MKKGNNLLSVVISISLILASFFSVGGLIVNDEDVNFEFREKVDQELIDVTGIIDLRINLQDDIDVKATAVLFRSLGIDVSRINTVSVNYIEATADASLIDEIAALDDVIWVQRIFEPQTFMNLIQSNTFMGQDTPQANAFTGSGVLAEVVDDGVDLTHTDLGQILYTDFTVVANSHGTSTSGIMFGDGTGDMIAQGMLYQATGVFADWGNGNALGIQNLWNGVFSSGNAGQNGVVQSNSWWNGATMDGEYDAMSNEIDQAIVDNPKVLSHWAIGNSNSGEAEGLMSAESISKNNMAVGAIYHKNTAGTADDDWSSNGAGNTPSRGPAADGRVKPDMIGAFDWIYTTDQMGAAGYTATNYYDNFGGTSGATPTVAGSSGLAYEMYQENFFGNNPTLAWPYSSTIKALMIADAYQYPMTGGNLITRNVQGWGSPDLQNMYNLGANYHVFEEYPQALNSGGSWSRGVFSDGINPLKITLAWIDPAAPAATIASRALINNLDLRVTSPSGILYWGNNGLGNALWSSSGTGGQRWSSTASYRDDLNNVENVFIQTPELGVWTVEVRGRIGDVAQGPQDFSVVASGATGISSMGTIELDQTVYILEDTATITVADLDLDTNPGTIQTVNVNVDSTTEPAGETALLTETAVDSATFVGTLTFSATNGAGILQVSDLDVVTATYNDADDGTGSPAVVQDTATIDGGIPGPPTALTVDWWGSGLQVLYTEDFEGDGTPTFAELGWTTGGAANDWQIGTPGGLGGQYGSPDPVGAFNGSFSIGNDLTGLGATPGDYEPNLALDSNWIYSPAIDASMAANINLFFQRYLNVEQPTYDHAYIEVATNAGGPWNQVYTNTITEADSSWAERTYDLSAWADGQPTVYVRFELGNSDGSWQYSGWNIDDLRVEGNVAGATDDNWLNWTLSPDDGAGFNDVAQYNIYRANNPGGPWNAGALWDTVLAGVGTYTDLGAGEFDGTTWWYVVRAEDTGGNEDTNANAVPEPGVSDLPPVSSATYAGASPTPNNPIAIDWSATDDNGLTQVELFYQYNAGGYVSWADASNPAAAAGTADSGFWNFNFPNGPGIYDLYTRATDNSPQVEAAPGTPDVTVEYNPSFPFDIPVSVGWNFISFPFAISGLPETVFNDTTLGDGGTDWDVMQWYDPTDPIGDYWKTYNKNYAGTQELSFVDNTMGFWINITANGGDGMLTTGLGGDYSAVPVNITLQPGWNMAGYPSNTPRAGNTTLPAEVTKMAVYNGAAAYNINEVPLTTVMSEGNAYWVYADAAAVWAVNP